MKQSKGRQYKAFGGLCLQSQSSEMNSSLFQRFLSSDRDYLYGCVHCLLPHPSKAGLENNNLMFCFQCVIRY